MKSNNKFDNTDVKFELLPTIGRPIKCSLCDHSFKVHPNNRETWENDKMLCPSCSAQYVCLPDTERILRILQDEFLDTRKQSILNEIYTIAFPYVKSLLKKKKLALIDSDEKLLYHTHCIVTFLIEDYCKKEEFMIDKSFGQYFNYKMFQSVYGKQEYTIEGKRIVGKNTAIYVCEECDYKTKGTKARLLICKCPKCGGDMDYEKVSVAVSSIDIENDENQKIQQIADKDVFSEQLNYRNSAREMRDHLLGLILGVEKYCNSDKENFVRMLNMRNYLKKGETVTDRFWKSYGTDGKFIFKQTLDILKKGLNNYCDT